MKLAQAYIAQVVKQPAILWKYPAVSAAELDDRSARQALEAIHALSAEQKPVDLLSVSGKLREQGNAQAAAALGTWNANDFAPASVIAELKKQAHSRRLHQALREAQETLKTTLSPETAQESLEQALSALSGDSTERRLEDLAEELVDEAERAAAGLQDEGVRTGLTAVDRRVGTLRPGSVTIIAARTSVGKTSLAMTVAAHNLEAGEAVGIVTLEETRETILRRFASMLSGVSVSSVEEGMIDPPRLRDWSEAVRKAARWPLHVEDRAGSIAEIRAAARRMVRAAGCRVLIVDYLQLISGARGQSDYQRVSEASRAVKGLAKELRVPVIAVCQLNRAAADKEPTLADLRDSGQIEQDGDVILLLWRRPAGPQIEGEDPTYEHLLVLAKHRTRRTGPIPIRFNAPRFRWEDDIDGFDDAHQ